MNNELVLRVENLMRHMRVLCKDIGPRPPTSAQERRAAEYVRRTLESLGVEAIREQRFKSHNSSGWVSIPVILAGVLAMPIAWIGGQWGHLIGGLLMLFGAYTTWAMLLEIPPLFQALINRWHSQNVIATLAPDGAVWRRVFLIAHLDTNKQRFQAPPPDPRWMKATLTFSLLVGCVGGLSLLAGALLNWPGVAWWQWALDGVLLVALVGLAFDETQPHVEGANDNACAVSILLGVAEALRAQPLQHTELTLLFTGSEETSCVGMESYLQEFAPPKENSYWIDLEIVGAGNLCYITRHGASYITEYYPAPDMVRLAVLAAQKNPEWGVIGKEMLILEEVANLQRRGYKAICLAGYNEKGFLPNWHRLTDTLENIEPGAMERAARYTWALVQEIDSMPNRP